MELFGNRYGNRIHATKTPRNGERARTIHDTGINRYHMHVSKRTQFFHDDGGDPGTPRPPTDRSCYLHHHGGGDEHGERSLLNPCEHMKREQRVRFGREMQQR